jgi:hypothetical protein
MINPRRREARQGAGAFWLPPKQQGVSRLCGHPRRHHARKRIDPTSARHRTPAAASCAAAYDGSHHRAQGLHASAYRGRRS